MTLVATIEAKKSAKNVYGAVDQAKRYAKGIQHLPSNVEVTQHNEFWYQWCLPPMAVRI